MFPNLSPFCAKLETYLRATKAPYEIHRVGNPRVGPKGKIPFVKWNNQKIGDSNFIIEKLKASRGRDLDTHLSPEQRAVSRAFLKMTEEHLVFCLLYFRWVAPSSWEKFSVLVLSPVPKLLRGFVKRKLHRDMTQRLKDQGIGRHSPKEILHLAEEDLKALDQLLSGKKFFFNQQLSTLDCAVFGVLGNFLYDPAETPLRASIQRYPALVSFVETIRQTYFADLAESLAPKVFSPQGPQIEAGDKNLSSGI